MPQHEPLLFLAMTTVIASMIGQTSAVVGGECDASAFSSAVLRSQSDLNSIRADCSKIVGSLSIECPTATSDPITSLDVFRLVEEVTGFLRVENCDQLSSLSGLQSLKVIHGRELFSDENGDGFAMYIVGNDLLASLGGLQNLSSIEGADSKGLGRVRVLGNSLLCWSPKVNWPTITGVDWRRVVYSLPGNADCPDKLSCHTSCSCDLCVGPGADHCQGDCSGYESDKETVATTFMGLLILLGCIGLFFGILFVTDRCGCRIVCFSKSVDFGIEETHRHHRAAATAVDDFSSKQLKANAAHDDPFSALRTSTEAKGKLSDTRTPTDSRPGTGVSLHDKDDESDASEGQ